MERIEKGINIFFTQSNPNEHEHINNGYSSLKPEN